jgi:general stress protein YciG
MTTITTTKPFIWPERDENGHFLPGHRWARKGGQARAEKLSAQRRREIARKGFDALVAKRFSGDRDAAKEWLVKKGQWANDQHYPPELRVFEDPGPMPGGEGSNGARN